MLWNYFRSAVRILVRQRAYGVMNIVGLAIGLAGSLALLLWVADEISYDGFHANADSIVRVGRSRIRNDQLHFDGLSSAPVGPAIKERFPGVLATCCIGEDDLRLKHGSEARMIDGLFVDPSFFEIFSFPLERGDPSEVLDGPNSIVLTPSAATSLFGDQDPVGKIFDNGLVVTGIVAEPPQNSTLQFDFIVNSDYYVRLGFLEREAWFQFGYETYLLLAGNADMAAIGRAIRNLFQEVEPDANIQLYLQPLKDIHLRPLGGGGRITYIYIFSLVACLLLVVACINFVNLATARSAQRGREIAVRKVAGASRKQLAVQVLVEQLMQTTLALLLAVCILELTLPMLSGFFGKAMSLDWSLRSVGIMLGVSIATGLAAGIYPAMILSSYRPAATLRASRTGRGRGSVGIIRKGLVVFQFAVSAGLIFSALVINQQMDFIRNKDLGLKHEAIVCVNTDNLETDGDTFERALAAQPGVEAAAAAFNPPAWVGLSMSDFDFEGKKEGERVTASLAPVDYNFVDVFGLEIVAGRNFSREFGTDPAGACLINEAAVRAMHMENPVGKRLDWMDEAPREIIGVVKDFHYASLHREVDPIILAMDSGWLHTLCIRLEPDNIATGLASIEKTFDEFRPGEAFVFEFFDNQIDREYRLEIRTRGIAMAFTIITTIVAVFGLLGLAATSIERRTKEIGIRKTLGSSTPGIVKLVTSEFMKLIMLGNIIVAPIAYYLMNQWLENFAYRVKPGAGAFLLALMITVLGALGTISFKAVRAARANPVNSLKYE